MLLVRTDRVVLHPVLEKVDVTVPRTQAMILVPTRELALQTSSVLKKLGQHIAGLSVIVSTGGTDLKEDIVRLMKPVHVIVATPGRILDLSNKGVADLSQCGVFVMDEADKLLSPEFVPLIDRLLSFTPSTRQVLLFSATFPKTVVSFRDQWCPGAHEINLMEELTLKGVTQYYAFVDERQKVHCFPESDHRVLTSKGLLFLEQIEAYLRVGEEVLFACYDVASKALLYRKGKLVFPDVPPQELLEFTSPGEDARWADGSGPYGTEGMPEDNGPSRHISLRVTPDHRMFVQHGNSTSDGTGVSWARLSNAVIPYHEVLAQELLSECTCPPARPGKADCVHRRAHVRLLACAEAGHAPQSTTRRQEVQRDLHLDDAQFAVFVELLGFWLGDGSMQYRHGKYVYSAVSFHQVKKTDRAWLLDQVVKVGLRPSQWRTNVHEDGGREKLQITDPDWFEFFDKEFGAKYKNSPRYSAPSATRSTNVDDGEEDDEDDVEEDDVKDDDEDVNRGQSDAACIVRHTRAESPPMLICDGDGTVDGGRRCQRGLHILCAARADPSGRWSPPPGDWYCHWCEPGEGGLIVHPRRGGSPLILANKADAALMLESDEDIPVTFRHRDPSASVDMDDSIDISLDTAADLTFASSVASRTRSRASSGCSDLQVGMGLYSMERDATVLQCMYCRIDTFEPMCDMCIDMRCLPPGVLAQMLSTDVSCSSDEEEADDGKQEEADDKEMVIDGKEEADDDDDEDYNPSRSGNSAGSWPSDCSAEDPPLEEEEPSTKEESPPIEKDPPIEEEDPPIEEEEPPIKEKEPPMDEPSDHEDPEEEKLPRSTGFPPGWGSTWGPGVPPESTKSVKHLPDWTLTELSAAETQLLIDGLRRAHGSFGPGVAHKTIYTSSCRFRDQLMQALLHCGYTACAGLVYRKDTIRGFRWHNQSVDKKTYPVKFVTALSKNEQINYRPITARADAWKVTWSDTSSSGSARGICWPSMPRQQCIARVPYDAQRDGRVWCVEVEHDDHLIIAQRAHRDADGNVTKQSRPIVIGNCLSSLFAKLDINQSRGHGTHPRSQRGSRAQRGLFS